MRSCDNCELGLIMDIIAASWIGFYPIKPSLNKDDDGGDDFVDNGSGDDCLSCGNHVMSCASLIFHHQPMVNWFG